MSPGHFFRKREEKGTDFSQTYQFIQTAADRNQLPGSSRFIEAVENATLISTEYSGRESSGSLKNRDT
jgi:hypothetical protein